MLSCLQSSFHPEGALTAVYKSRKSLHPLKMKSIEQLPCGFLKGRSCLREPTVCDWKGWRTEYANVAVYDKWTASDRNWNSVREGVNSVFWKITTLLLGNCNFMNFGTRFYILPGTCDLSTLKQCFANWSGSGLFFVDLMSCCFFCLFVFLNPMYQSRWQGKVQLVGEFNRLSNSEP